MDDSTVRVAVSLCSVCGQSQLVWVLPVQTRFLQSNHTREEQGTSKEKCKIYLALPPGHVVVEHSAPDHWLSGC